MSDADGVKDFEVVDSTVTRPETTTDSPTLSGVVYRKTGAGKQPVAGAVIEFEYSPVIAATTITDKQGRYSLCQLPAGRAGLDVWLNGVSLGGANDIVGRALIVHAAPDDYASQPSGNSGARIACGVIEAD